MAEDVFARKKSVSLFDHIFCYFSFIYCYQYYLFALYTDDLIIQLKHSGSGSHVGPPRANAGNVTALPGPSQWRWRVGCYCCCIECIYEPCVFSHSVSSSSAECNRCSSPSSLDCGQLLTVGPMWHRLAFVTRAEGRLKVGDNNNCAWIRKAREAAAWGPKAKAWMGFWGKGSECSLHQLGVWGVL